jgi:REP element-mobilizing transposase RayT
MGLADSKHKTDLRNAGWFSRGYLPHFDGRELPQFLSLHLFDSIPAAVLERWKRELNSKKSLADRILLQRRIERFLDQGFGGAFMKDYGVATMIQNVLLGSDGEDYRLWAWVVMPNHIHMLATRFESCTLAETMQSLKSITSHKANKILERHGHFWMVDYFDRYIRNSKHFAATVRYIEYNPVKARLCKRPEDWPFSSAWFRARTDS